MLCIGFLVGLTSNLIYLFNFEAVYNIYQGQYYLSLHRVFLQKVLLDIFKIGVKKQYCYYISYYIALKNHPLENLYQFYIIPVSSVWHLHFLEHQKENVFVKISFTHDCHAHHMGSFPKTFVNGRFYQALSLYLGPFLVFLYLEFMPSFKVLSEKTANE